MSAFYTFFLKKVKVPSVFSATVKSSFAKNHLDGELLHFGARVLYIYHVHHSLPERLYYNISGLSSWWIDESLERFMLLLSQMVELPSHAHQINLKLPVFLHQALSFMSQSFRSLMSPRGPLRHLLCPCWPYARYSHSGQLLVKCARCRNIYRSIESPSELIQMILDAEMNNKISLPVRWVNFLFTPWYTSTYHGHGERNGNASFFLLAQHLFLICVLALFPPNVTLIFTPISFI